MEELLRIVTQERGRVLIGRDGASLQPYMASWVKVNYNDDLQAIELYDRRNDNKTILDPIAWRYDKVINEDTGQPFTSYEDMQDVINNNFYTASQTAPMVLSNSPEAPLYVHVCNNLDISKLSKEESQLLIKGLLQDIKTILSNQSVQVSNFPVQFEIMNEQGNPIQVTGSIAISNLPTVQRVSVENFVGNQDVTVKNVVTAHIDNIPANQTVTISNWQATQAISAASLPLPNGAATTAKQTELYNFLFSMFGLDVDGGLKVHVQNNASQAITAAALPLPANAATETTLALIKTAIQSVDSKFANPMAISLANTELVIMASATKTASGNTVAFVNLDKQAAIFTVNITAISGVLTTLTVKVQFQDVASGVWLDLGVVTSGLTVLGLVSLNVNAKTNYPLPKNYRLAWTITGTNPSVTFSLGGHFFN